METVVWTEGQRVNRTTRLAELVSALFHHYWTRCLCGNP